MIKRLWHQLKYSGILRKILLFLVLGFLLPIVIVVFFFLTVQYREMNQQAVAARQSINSQILMNVKSILDSAEKYTLYP